MNSSVLEADTPSVQFNQIREEAKTTAKKRGGIPQKSTIVMMAHAGDPLMIKSR